VQIREFIDGRHLHCKTGIIRQKTLSKPPHQSLHRTFNMQSNMQSTSHQTHLSSAHARARTWRVWHVARALAVMAIAASAGIAASLSAQVPGQNAPGKIPDEQLFGFIGKDPLPPGTIPWQILRQVKLVESKPSKDAKNTKAPAKGEARKAEPVTLAQMRPEFSPRIMELDKQEIKLYGFVMPLSTAPKQKHFLLSPLPSHCPYCVYQGPDSLVEVLADVPVEFNQWEPIVVSGKLELVYDPQLFYRLTNAKSVKF
jgi:uncharacterized protein